MIIMGPYRKNEEQIPYYGHTNTLQNLAPPYFSSLYHSRLPRHLLKFQPHRTGFNSHLHGFASSPLSASNPLPLTSYLYPPTVIIPSRTSIYCLQLNVQVTITMETFCLPLSHFYSLCISIISYL